MSYLNWQSDNPHCHKFVAASPVCLMNYHLICARKTQLMRFQGSHCIYMRYVKTRGINERSWQENVLLNLQPRGRRERERDGESETAIYDSGHRWLSWGWRSVACVDMADYQPTKPVMPLANLVLNSPRKRSLDPSPLIPSSHNRKKMISGRSKSRFYSLADVDVDVDVVIQYILTWPGRLIRRNWPPAGRKGISESSPPPSRRRRRRPSPGGSWLNACTVHGHHDQNLKGRLDLFSDYGFHHA